VLGRPYATLEHPSRRVGALAAKTVIFAAAGAVP
jgi:hypothetical protein